VERPEREIEIDSVDQVNLNLEGLESDVEFEIAEVKLWAVFKVWSIV
jgi:hypothetical protein